MIYFDPLEQFSIEVYTSYLYRELPGIFTTHFYTNIGKMVLFNCILVLLVIYSYREVYVGNKFQKLTIFLFNFVTNILKDALAVKKYSFILLLYFTFLFIFVSNILGMLPYSMTVTSHLILTLYFSLAFFIGNNIIGLCYHKEKFFVLFLPEGVPVPIIPFLILIEYVSYLSRIFSLAIRLFANMMSGHILLKILISFIWAILTSKIIN